MTEAHFIVTVRYENGMFMIKAVEKQFETYNFAANNISSVVTKQFKITRDLKKVGVKAYFEYAD